MVSLKEAFAEDILKWGWRRQWATALASFAEMQENTVDIDAAAYSAVIRACGEKVKQWERALVILGEMQQQGFQPSTEAVTALATSCSSARNWERALRVMLRLPELAVAPDDATFATALHACRGGGFWEEALAILDEMERSRKFPPTEASYNAVLDACEAARRMDVYDEVEDRAAELGFGIVL